MKFILECDKVEFKPYGLIGIDFGDTVINIDGELYDRMKSYKAAEAYREGVNNGKRFVRQEAQKVYRRLAKLRCGEMKEIFGDSYCENIIQDFTVDEIEQRLDEYKTVTIGDEIRFLDGGKRAVVVNVSDDSRIHVYTEKKQFASFDIGKGYEKTGRHFDEVEQLLKKLNNYDNK